MLIILLAATQQPKGAQIRLNGSEYKNGSTVNWGTLGVGAYNMTYQIINYTGKNITLTLTAVNMPEGTYLQSNLNNTPIQNGKSVKGELCMVVTNRADIGKFNYQLNFQYL